MADLTPELLAQLERDAAEFPGAFVVEESSRDNYAEGEMTLTYTGEGEDVPVTVATEIQGAHIAEPLARMLNAVTALVAAAKERDQLRVELEKMRQPIAPSVSEDAERLVSGLMAQSRRTPTVRETLARQAPVMAKLAEIEKLERERDELRRAVSDIRGALDAHGHDGTFEAAAKLRDEAVRLRATIERIKAFVADNAIINDFELEEILKGETP